MSEILSKLRVLLTYGSILFLSVCGLVAFIANDTKLGWALVAAVSGIMFRELLHVIEARAAR